MAHSVSKTARGAVQRNRQACHPTIEPRGDPACAPTDQRRSERSFAEVAQVGLAVVGPHERDGLRLRIAHLQLAHLSEQLVTGQEVIGGLLVDVGETVQQRVHRIGGKREDSAQLLQLILSENGGSLQRTGRRGGVRGQQSPLSAVPSLLSHACSF